MISTKFSLHFDFQGNEKEFAMKRITVLMVGLALLTSTSGCYCTSPWFGSIGNPYYGRGAYGGYGAYGSGPCSPGGCGLTQPGVIPNGTTFTPQSSYYSTFGTMQAGVPVATPVVVAPPAAYPMTAFGPLETLPTY